MMLSDPAGRCHCCGAKGDSCERWIESDTCDICAYWLAMSRDRSENTKRLAREELRKQRRLNSNSS